MILAVKLVVFAIASAGALAISWQSLSDPRSHGFYRFFAFEILFGLLVLNVVGWFRDPFALHQIASWLLLISSAALAFEGFRLLRVVGQPEGGDFENTTVLVSQGAYKYVRHPLYSSLLFLGWGIFFKSPSLVDGLLAVIATVFLVVTAKAEEAELRTKFGDAYTTYAETTRLFIPFVF